MKKLITLSVLSCFSVLVVAQLTTSLSPKSLSTTSREKNCFRNFQESIDGDSKINAYLLSYVTYLTYPERLALVNGVSFDRTDDARFNVEFKKRFEPMFWDGETEANRPVIAPIVKLAAGNPAREIGLDPEAVLISTPKFIIISFRGTDRVLSQSDLNREWGEWLGTDFKAPLVEAPGHLPGRVHQGFWQSVDLVRGKLDALVNQYNPNKSKHIWVTGHSLGAAQAEVYATYLITSDMRIPASKLHCYVYGGPSFVGDGTFANKVNSYGDKFQRFEYQMDMVTVVGPGLANSVGSAASALFGNGCVLTCSYQKSGKRNWYDSPTHHYQNFRERDFALGDAWNVSSACDHQPNWLVRAIYNTLTEEQKATVPGPAPKTNLTACNPDGSPVTNASVFSAVTQITFNALSAGLESLATNLVGGGDGNYKISNYKFNNWSKKYLTWNNIPGSQLTVSEKPTIFTLTKKLTGGYRISRGGGNMSADVEYSFGIPTGKERSNNIIMRPNDNMVGDEETWYLMKVPNVTNGYVLYNWNTKKVLDAPDHCAEGGDCRVNEFGSKSNDETQVWILKKQ